MSTTSFETWFRAAQPAIPLAGALAVLELHGEGATLPFIARYRKERTGNLDEVQIRRVLDARQRFDKVVARQAFVIETIDKQKKLTPELRERILATFDPDALEDLYLPFKQKRQTKAALAREAGLQPLADWIWNCGHGTETPQEGQTLELWAFTFRNPEKGFAEAENAIQGAEDILTERLAEQPELRQAVRARVFAKGFVYSSKADGAKPASKFDKYFDHKEAVKVLLQPQNSHRYLAMRRGESENELKLRVAGPPATTAFDEALLAVFESAACTVPASPGAAVLARAARTALADYVKPSIDAEVHRALKAAADDAAIAVFAANLRRLLLEAPFGPKAVVGIDPGQRTGCKLAVVDETGRYLANDVLHLESDDSRAKARDLLKEALGEVEVRAIAVGNGTGGREAEVFLRAAVRELEKDVPVVMLSEAGASVYSASDIARGEFPDLDLTVRGAISIARRLQDPLAELVKVEPKSIGVGQYQHDVAQHLLRESLDGVVDSCVNQVGVNLNTASEKLLSHVSGIGPALAKAVVGHREQRGLFKSRDELRQVPRFSKKTFEQAAGFLRIPDAENPLDNTGVHPERYEALNTLAVRLEKPVRDLLGSGVALVKDDAAFREQVGEFTLADIVAELEKPGRDPRPAFTPFQYREDVKELKDLKPGMVCPGIVTNVTNFGAFVDVGVHHDGLVHVSQLPDGPPRDPSATLHAGMRVSVRVLEVNLEKKQIAFTMKPPRERPKPPPRRREEKDKHRPGPEGRPARAETGAAEGGKPSSSPYPRRPPAPRGDRAQMPGARPLDRGPGPRPSGPRSSGPKPGPRPSGPRPSGPTPPGGEQAAGKTAGARPPGRGPRSSPPEHVSRPAPPARQSFNNPFAVLADLRKDLKDKG